MQKDLHHMFQRVFHEELELPEKVSDLKSNGPKFSFRDLTILLAEDNLINQKIVIQLLSKQNIKVITASNGIEAVERAKERKYDFILMDVQMPEQDGFEATRQIRRDKQGHNAETPIIALTANAMKGDRELCLEAGMNNYLTKPLNPEDVLQTIEKYCK